MSHPFALRRLLVLLSVSVLHAVLLSRLVATPANVTQWHNDAARTGVNPNEAVLASSNVNSTDFGKLFVIPTDGWVTAQPLYLSGVNVPGKGFHNVVYIATAHDTVYGCDADAGTVLWQTTLCGTGETSSDNRHCDIFPEVGVTATPIISNGVLYVQAMSKDQAGAYHQRLHALDVTTGAEVAGGPVEITATIPGTGVEPIFNPAVHFDRAGLALAHGLIFTAWTAFCDGGSYEGMLIGYDTSLKQAGAFSVTPNGEQGSIWQSGAAPAVDANGNLFFLTGNGTFDSTLDANGFPVKADFSGSFLKVNPAASGGPEVVDYFSPFNTVKESSEDLDLGSGGTMLLPDMSDSTGQTRHLAVGAGKDGHIYIVDRDNMGKFNSSSNNIYQDVPVTSLQDQVFSSPAFFNGHLYYGVYEKPLKLFDFTNARLDPTPKSQSPTTFGYPGITPAVSSNGLANGIVWVADSGGTNSPAQQPNAIAVLRAYDAGDVSKELYNSNQAPNNRDQFGNGNRFVLPTIANGKVYVGTQHGVGVFGLLDPPRLANISTRAQIGTGDNVLIAGFIVQGSAPRKLIIRGIGPSLQANGSRLPGALQDPTLELHDATGQVVISNDNWGDGTQANDIRASGVAPTDPRESAILQTLNPGAYTAILRGVNTSTGIGLVDFYDISAKYNSTLADISSRGVVGTGDNALIGGFIVQGVAAQRVIIRAIGPDLAQAGVAGALSDPVLELHDKNGAIVATNDNWSSDHKAEIEATGLAPQDERDAAIVATLPSSNYTAVIRGAANAAGIALVEAYALK